MISTDFTTNFKVSRKIYGLIGACITLLVPYLLMLENQISSLDSKQSFCPFKMLTGFPCPGCGITKSLVYCYQGELTKALQFHVLGPAVILFCVATILVVSAELITKRNFFNKWLFNKNLAYGLGVFLAIYHLIRLIFFIQNKTLMQIAKESIWF